MESRNRAGKGDKSDREGADYLLSKVGAVILVLTGLSQEDADDVRRYAPS